MTRSRACRGGSLALLALLLLLAVAACGKKGEPRPPPGVPNTYPRAYPSG